MTNQKRFFKVSEFQKGERLDLILTRLNPDLSRSRIQNLIHNLGVEVDTHAIFSAAYKVHPGQTLELTLPDPQPLDLHAENIPLDVLFEDTHLLVLNKPPGLVVHPSPGHAQNTLVHALLHHCGPSLRGIGDVQRPGILHRLDKGTSGLMVVAKNDLSHGHLSAQFAAHTLTRQYLAFCWGCPQPTQGRVDTHLGRHPQHRQKRAVVPDIMGKKAITHYRVVHYHAPLSLVECTLKTGRTHQIRVHLSHMGHSLVGDPLYGRAPTLRALKDFEELRTQAQLLEQAERPALHSWHLAFEHPATGALLSFHAPLPQDLGVLERYVRG